LPERVERKRPAEQRHKPDRNEDPKKAEDEKDRRPERGNDKGEYYAKGNFSVYTEGVYDIENDNQGYNRGYGREIDSFCSQEGKPSEYIQVRICDSLEYLEGFPHGRARKPGEENADENEKHVNGENAAYTS
jgi:hypothetical protein